MSSHEVKKLILDPSNSAWLVLASLVQMFWSTGELPDANLIQATLNSVKYWNIWMSVDVEERKNILQLHRLSHLENVI